MCLINGISLFSSDEIQVAQSVPLVTKPLKNNTLSYIELCSFCLSTLLPIQILAQFQVVLHKNLSYIRFFLIQVICNFIDNWHEGVTFTVGQSCRESLKSTLRLLLFDYGFAMYLKLPPKTSNSGMFSRFCDKYLLFQVRLLLGYVEMRYLTLGRHRLDQQLVLVLWFVSAR